MQNKEKHLSLRIQEELLRKFDYVSKYDGRSMNGTLLVMIRRYVEAFEQKYGPIELEEQE